MKNYVATITILFAAFTTTFGQDLSKDFNIKKGIALQGYDPVSYFKSGPILGNSQYKSNYHGVTYLFNSQENLDIFNQDPAKYEPQYGGWCAYAMGKSGDKVKIDPTTYKITNGKLYLFYNFKNYNTLKDWNEDENNLLKNANKLWQEIISQ